MDIDRELIAETLAWKECRLSEKHFYCDHPRAPDIADFRDMFLDELKKLLVPDRD